MRKKDKFIEEIEKQVNLMRYDLIELELQKDEALKYIEEECVYDKHLQGYCYGLKPGQVKQLVLKLGGRNVKD